MPTLKEYEERDAKQLAYARAMRKQRAEATPEMLAAREAWLDAVTLESAAKVYWQCATKAADAARAEADRLWPAIVL